MTLIACLINCYMMLFGRSLGAKSSPTEADLLQNLIPSPGSSYGSYSQLQHAAAACNASSLYNLSHGDAQHLLTPGLPQHTEQPVHQKPQSQPQLQDISEAMRMLSLATPAGYEVSLLGRPFCASLLQLRTSVTLKKIPLHADCGASCMCLVPDPALSLHLCMHVIQR